MAETVLEGMLSMDMGEKVVVVPGVAEIRHSIMQRFKWPDYIMFILMLLVCIVIGLYFGIYRASTNAQEYLLGGRKMQIFPVTMSLIASFISGISILGIPTETYLYGIQFIYCLGALVIMSLLMNHVYLPVLYGLKLTSAYEYFERRFNKNVRIFGCILGVINLTTWLPVVIYVPTLAFNQVNGVNVHLITPIVCIVCIFYTSMGGLKAVVWTDVIQAIIMFGAMVMVAVKGTIDIGGLETVLKRNLETNRIERPNLDLNPLTRHTLWSLTFGGAVYFLQSAAINQSMLQRYLALPSLLAAQKAVWFFALGMCTIITLCIYCGLLTFATFYQCDPLTTKLAREKDQLLPLLVMQVLEDYPGLSGIFVAGILSASLSSLSTGLNAMCAFVIEDFYHFFFTKPLTEKQAAVIMRLTVIIFGALWVSLVYVIEQLGAVFQMTLSIGSIASGPLLGMFTMGMLLPWVNAKGALTGAISSLVFMAYVVFQAQASIASGTLTFEEKPLTTEGCHYHFVPKQSMIVNIHFNVSDDHKQPEETFMLHHISYLWYTLVGCSITIVGGVFVSFLTKPLDPRDVEPILLASCVRKMIQPREFPNQPGERIIYAFEMNNEAVKIKSKNETTVPEGKVGEQE